MTQKYCFETIPPGSNHPGRIRGRLAKRLAREQGRKQKEIGTSQREAAQIRSMIASLNRTIASLDGSIAADLEKSQIRDPRHYAFPIAARTMIARRDNLAATIAALSDRLSNLDPFLPEAEAA
jgi:chorismate mutase